MVFENRTRHLQQKADGTLSHVSSYDESVQSSYHTIGTLCVVSGAHHVLGLGEQLVGDWDSKK